MLHHICVVILKSKMSRNHRNRRRGSREAQKLAAEGMAFVAGETIRSTKKGKGKATVDARPENTAEDPTTRNENRLLKKDLAEAKAVLEIMKAALVAAMKSGMDMIVETNLYQLADPTAATQDWKDMKKEEALLELAIRTATDVLHLSHKEPGELWPNATAVRALEGIVSFKDNSFARISSDSNYALEDDVDVCKHQAFLTAHMMDLEQATAQKRDVGDYKCWNERSRSWCFKFSYIIKVSALR